MTYLFYIMLSIVLIVIQTAIIPELVGIQVPYNLIALIVFYLGLYQPFRQGLPMVLVLGFIMDNISGAPFGLYITTFFWLFLGVTWVTKFLRVRNIVLIPFIIAIGILVENMMFIGTLFLAGSIPSSPLEIGVRVAYQVLWAVATGPFLVLAFRFLHIHWHQWTTEMLADQGEQSE